MTSFFKINKAIYGLKQASRQWFKHFHDFIHQQGFQQSEVDPCLYTTSDSSNDLIELQAALSAEVQIKYLGSPTHFLGDPATTYRFGFLDSSGWSYRENIAAIWCH